MANPFAQAGASADPSRYAPLYTNRFFTGYWTNRSLLRDAATSYLNEKYTGGRFDSVLAGFDMELSSRMTWWKRPGHTVYNSQSFPPIWSYYAFRVVIDGQTSVRLIVDTSTAVYDATGPNTKTLLWTKASGAGKTRFISIGNTLYFMDGVSAKQMIVPAKTWQPNTAYNTGDSILDTNGNIQKLTPLAPTTVSNNITSTQYVKVLGTIPGQYVYALVVTCSANFTSFPSSNEGVLFAGLSTRTALNGATLFVSAKLTNLHTNANQLGFVPYGNTVDASPVTETTGTVSFTHQAKQNQGNSGAGPVSWATGLGATTVDGALTWTNYGPPISDMGKTGPTVAPVVSATNGLERFWQAYSAFPLWYTVLDSFGQVEAVTNNTLGGTSATGMSEPSWSTNLGGLTYDGSIVWTQCGAPLAWQASADVLRYQSLTDTNGNLQIATTAGKTGASPPGTWASTVGTTTTDGTVTWTCAGAGALLATASFGYAYAYHFTDGSVSAISPLTIVPNGLLGPAGKFSMTITGQGTTQPTCDQIWIYRTPRGDLSSPLFLDSVPNLSPGSGTAWSYVDVLPDSALNINLPATIGVAGNGPPAGATAPCFHLGRIFIIVNGNVIQYSTGPDVPPGAGNGNTMYPPLSSFALPTAAVKLISTTVGLLVITVSDIRIIAGRGDPTSPLVPPVLFLEGTGALSYDVVTMQNSTIHMLTSVGKGLSLDPGAGVVEVGEPIADVLETQLDPLASYVTWHESTTQDTALYFADGSTGWYRVGQLAAPESGYAWSVKANIQGGTSAVQSVEVTPGIRKLLVGPKTSGPILQRDLSTRLDNGAAYAGMVKFGSLVLAEHGEVAELVFLAYDCIRVGTRPSISVLLGELSGTFEKLPRWTKEPPLLPSSTTLFSERHYFMQNQAPVWCRHLQVEFDFPAENAANEIATYSLYGAIHNERSVPQ